VRHIGTRKKILVIHIHGRNLVVWWGFSVIGALADLVPVFIDLDVGLFDMSFYWYGRIGNAILPRYDPSRSREGLLQSKVDEPLAPISHEQRYVQNIPIKFEILQ